MALQETSLRILFSGGIETKVDDKAIPSAKLHVLENGVFTKAVSLRKRFGYEDLGRAIDGTSDLMTGALRLGQRDEELLAFTPTRCYSRSADADTWSDAGPVYSVVGTDVPLVKTGTQQTMPDVATLAGVRAVAWEDSAGGVWWSVVDAESGRIFRTPTQAHASGRSPRCVAAGANLHIYYAVPSSTAIEVVVVDPAHPGAAVTPITLVSDLDAANPVYDAAPTAGRAGTPAVIAWHEAGSTSYKLGYVHASGVLGTPAVGLFSTITEATALMDAASPIAVIEDNELGVTAVAFTSGGTVNVNYYEEGLNLTLQQATMLATAVTRLTLVLATQSAVAPFFTLYVAAEETAIAASERFVNVVPVYDFVPGSAITIRSVGLASRAFKTSRTGDAFAVFVHDTTYFNTYVTLRLSDFLCVGRHTPGAAAGAPTRPHLSSAHVIDDVVAVALPVRDRLLTENDDKFRETGIRLVEMDFANDTSHQTAQLGRGLYMGGACPQHYDGSGWREQGFHFGPEVVATVNAGGGSMTPSTTYLYRYAYEWTDAQGEVHRGPTSVGTLITMGGGDTQVTHTLPPLRVTGKTGVRICVFRSLAAKTGNTAQLFRVTSLDPAASGANGYVASNKTVDTVTFLDRMSDATLALQEELYTDGGILSNDPSALGTAVAVGKSRLFWTDPGDGNTIRFSQTIEDGYGVECPPDLIVKVNPRGGPVTALVVRDDGAVAAFKAGGIYLFGGDGPLPNGDSATSGFSVPVPVASPVGCTNPQSIVETPVGFMFQAGSQGIWVLDRAGSVQYVGAPVEAYNAQRVTRASVMPDRTQVVFLTDAGSTLLYDYLFGQWSTFSNHEGLDGAVVGGSYYYLRTSGKVYKETVGAYTDAGIRIRLRLETAWIHMAEHLQGFQRFWEMLLIGTWTSAHQLGIQYTTDYETEWTDSYWLDATGESSSTGWITGTNANTVGEDPISGTTYGEGLYGAGVYGGDGPDVYQWRLTLNEQGQSIRFRFEDFERAGLAGPSFELTEMLIVGGMIGSARKPFPGSRSK